MKKIIAGLSVLGIAAVGFGALASESWAPSGDTHSDAYVKIKNKAKVTTETEVIANTGDNEANALSAALVGSSRAKGGKNLTGDAFAGADVEVVTNTTDVDVDQSGCGCERDGDSWLNAKVKVSNDAKVKTETAVVANTGGNEANAASLAGIGSSRATGGRNVTGDAEAVAVVGVVTNSTLVTVSQ